MASVLIEIANQQGRRIPRAWLDRAVRAVLRNARVSKAEISVAVVDDPMIRKLNRRFLNHDYATDVLSFLFREPNGSGRLEGEIVVSAETATRSAKKLGIAFRDELVLYAVHGALHLVGHQDRSDAEREKMRHAERETMRQIGLPKPVWHASKATQTNRDSCR